MSLVSLGYAQQYCNSDGCCGVTAMLNIEDLVHFQKSRFWKLAYFCRRLLNRASEWTILFSRTLLSISLYQHSLYTDSLTINLIQNSKKTWVSSNRSKKIIYQIRIPPKTTTHSYARTFNIFLLAIYPSNQGKSLGSSTLEQTKYSPAPAPSK